MANAAKSKKVNVKNVFERVRTLEGVDVLRERPADSFTVEEYRDEFNLGERQAFYRIKELVRAGKVRKVKFAESGIVKNGYVLQEVEEASSGS